MMDEKQLLARDREARSDALDISRSFIVQAPAGSGKTELLIQRYLKLLSSVDNPEEVLAITFTRKAAAEMQYRVLNAMRMAHDGDDPSEEHRQLTAELAAAALKRDRELGWQLLENPRRLRIQTLDSLNAMIARWQPISSPQSASGLRIVVDAEQKFLLQSAAQATLDWLTADSAETAAIREVLSHIDNNTGAYSAYLEQMLATRDQWLPFVGSGLMSTEEADHLRRRLENNLENTVVEHLKHARAVIPENLLSSLTTLQNYAAARLIENGLESVPVCALQHTAGLPEANAAAIGQWCGLAELLLTKAGQFRKQVDKRIGFPPGDDGQKAAMQELLADVADMQSLADALHGVRTLPPVSFTDEQWRVLLALFRLLPVAVSELQRLFLEQGVSDHIEIALAATAALGTADNPGDVALLLDYQVRHLLVDEMQD
ncbi:MAG: UvrD-helicase domain-containing protein, partial [Woeseiaceae bacterium]|nr:UvrD-helicase domain-containing protein [Woeseiaceae bacterium]